MSESDAPNLLVQPLCNTLTNLSRNPYPHVPNPENCKRRASVAVILRVRPNYSHWPSDSDVKLVDTTQDSAVHLESFFSQSWVQNGDPETVFIKRATRDGDRWTGHVALPGGKRDPEDEDDKATAIRETWEEIGLDLTSPDAIFIGNLPERVVSASWGKVPIMVLCPFVFLWTKPDMPPLRLQPTEVASTHWVPLRILLSPTVRTYEYVDVSDRFAKQGGFIVRAMLRSVLGMMRFSAMRLIPSESLYSSSIAEFFSPEKDERKATLGDRISKLVYGNQTKEIGVPQPLLLWGLTMGIFCDMLEQLPPHNAIQLWEYPTFTSPDLRFIINLLTHSLKERNLQRLQDNGVGNQTAMDMSTEAVDLRTIDGEIGNGKSNGGNNANRSYAVGIKLDGYYDLARKGIWITTGIRSAGVVAALVYTIRILRRRN
ncbi:hypothetical protein PVAG01_07297 [Phlyctema vagabunda]|uniref:Nudix hydrolase domain-containing protein n=1 Tax=Phlyctema vagabunda TaxID=108571 RepID=A0ABR4PBZ6_9HELO